MVEFGNGGLGFSVVDEKAVITAKTSIRLSAEIFVVAFMAFGFWVCGCLCVFQWCKITTSGGAGSSGELPDVMGVYCVWTQAEAACRMRNFTFSGKGITWYSRCGDKFTGSDRLYCHQPIFPQRFNHRPVPEGFKITKVVPCKLHFKIGNSDDVYCIRRKLGQNFRQPLP